MKFTTENIMAGLALLALGYVIGQRRSAAADKTAATTPSTARDPAQWWTYAGQWQL